MTIWWHFYLVLTMANIILSCKKQKAFCILKGARSISDVLPSPPIQVTGQLAHKITYSTETLGRQVLRISNKPYPGD